MNKYLLTLAIKNVSISKGHPSEDKRSADFYRSLESVLGDDVVNASYVPSNYCGLFGSLTRGEDFLHPAFTVIAQGRNIKHAYGRVKKTIEHKLSGFSKMRPWALYQCRLNLVHGVDYPETTLEAPVKETRDGCGKEIPFFGAHYPDGRCINGYMWDLDAYDKETGTLEHGGDDPCPFCNADEYYSGLKDDLINDGYCSFGLIGGDDVYKMNFYKPLSLFPSNWARKYNRHWRRARKEAAHEFYNNGKQLERCKGRRK